MREVDGRTDGVILNAEFVSCRVYTYIQMSCTSGYSAMRTCTCVGELKYHTRDGRIQKVEMRKDCELLEILNTLTNNVHFHLANIVNTEPLLVYIVF